MSSDKETEFFSTRHGYKGDTPPIEFVETMPSEFHYSLLQCARNCGLDYYRMYCEIANYLCIIIDANKVFESTDKENFNRSYNILIRCKWYEVYDIAEILFVILRRESEHKSDSYMSHMNRYFSKNGVGWEFSKDGKIERRHERALKKSVEDASNALKEGGAPKTADMINDAMRDISHRPNPKTEDAIKSAIGAMESVSRKVLNSKKTLGKITSQLDIPKPLDEAVEKLWGFSSENARHGSEDNNPSVEDAELVIHVSAAVCTYLIKKKQQKNNA